jgi:hypothetical protein
MDSRSSACLPSRARAALALAIGLVAAAWTGAPCRADLVIAAPDVTAAPGSSGSFDVLIFSTGGTFDVAGDTIELTLTGLAGVTFTGVLPQANPPNSYIYVVSATTLGGTFSFDSFPTNQFDVFDSEFGPLGFRAIGAGDVFGVVNVSYSVAPSATPGASGTLAIGPDTSLSDVNGGNIAFTAQNGSFTVAPVPEPTSAILLGLGCAAIVLRTGMKWSRDHSRLRNLD